MCVEPSFSFVCRTAFRLSDQNRGLCDRKENAPMSYQLAKDTPLTNREHIPPETLRLFLDDTCGRVSIGDGFT
jgi:hypothetical protein